MKRLKRLKQLKRFSGKTELKEKLKSQRGLTLVELLAAILILLLVASVMVVGTATAQRHFRESIRRSEAVELFGTIEAILTNELRYTTSVKTLEGSTKVDTFFSVTYAVKHNDTALVALDEDGYISGNGIGELALGYEEEFNRILGSAAYPSGLKAKCSIRYDETEKLFTVDLRIIEEDSLQEYASDIFEVHALNMK